MLALGQETGTLTLSLRHPDDPDVQEKRSVVDQRQLLTGDRAGELREKRYRTVQIIRGAPGTAKVAGAGD
jgi:Flp pilus assembly protein CpaB